MPVVRLAELEELVERALVGAGASQALARATRQALIYAESRGLPSHGLSRVGQYSTHLRNGRADGQAQPRVIREKPAAVLVDAGESLAYLACELAVDEAISRARAAGSCIASITNSHHFGMAAYHLEKVAAAGMVGLAFSNSPSAMAAWGGKQALFGTNPIGAVFPRTDAPPIMIDLSLSEVARGKIMVAAKKGAPIPLGWALDKNGAPTTDAKAALEGMMLPAGGVKGAMLALTVELLCVALSGAAFGYEADSFFVDAGNRPRLGQCFWVINPDALAGNGTYFARVESLVAAMLIDEDVRLPGARRAQIAVASSDKGVEVADAILDEIRRLASH
jgi:(2R)-3-sulfolactate dehydrogenase (NADP+)